MCRSQLQEVYISLLLSQILLIINEGYCAPKLGGVMFEQLLLETFIDDENNTNTHYNNKRAFTVPAYHVNIKNTTSIYAKLTGHSLKNSVVSASERKHKESKETDITTNSSYTITNTSRYNSTGLVSANTNTSSSSKLIFMEPPTTTVRINVVSHVSDLEKHKENKHINTDLKVKVNTEDHKSKQKENVRKHAPSRIDKSRRAILQSNGYAFNGDICQMRGDRVLCGYDNQELPLPETERKPENDDCLIHGDRIECGYAKLMADGNRRNIKQKSAKINGSDILAFNVATNLSTTATITSNTTYSTTVTNPPVPTATTEISTADTPSHTNTKNKLDLSQFETQKLIDHIEKMISSIITNSNISTISHTIATSAIDTTTIVTNSASPNSTIVNEPKISGFKIMELINRVERIIASTATNSTSPTTPPISAIDIKLSKALEMLSRVEKKLQSLVTNAHKTAATMFTTSSFPISTTTTSSSPTTIFKSAPPSTTSSTTTSTSTTTTTTTSTTTTTTTPVPHIEERELCVEKDGRIVCYDNEEGRGGTQEDYEEDFLEK